MSPVITRGAGIA